MKVLVTGGAGFIGSNLCRRLIAESAVDEVRVIDDLSTGHEENLHGLDVDFRRASILDPAALDSAVHGVDAVVHLAALGSVPRSIIDPASTHEANATGTLRVLQSAQAHGGSHVILASSSSVYGSNPALPKEESQLCMPVSPYAVSKLAAEQYAVAFARCYDLPVLPLRFFNVYGPRQRAGHVYAAVVPTFIDAALRGEALPVNGDGLQSRDFTFVGTVTEILTRAVLDRTTGEPTNLAFGSRTTLVDLVAHLSELMETKLEIEWREPRAGDVRDSRADNSRLRGLFGEISPVSLDEGLRQSIEWMRASTEVPH